MPQIFMRTIYNTEKQRLQQWQRLKMFVDKKKRKKKRVKQRRHNKCPKCREEGEKNYQSYRETKDIANQMARDLMLLTLYISMATGYQRPRHC